MSAMPIMSPAPIAPIHGSPADRSATNRAASPPTDQAAIDLSIQGQRLSRQFQKSLDTLRDIQAERTERERRDLKDAAALLEFHKHKGIPWQPADHGFVFSKDHVESSRHIEYVLVQMRPQQEQRVSEPRP